MTNRHDVGASPAGSCQNVGPSGQQPAGFGTSRRRSLVEHPLLTASRMNRSLAALVGFVVLAPATAMGQLAA